MNLAREPWPLLATIAELIDRDGWQDDAPRCHQLERRICDETTVLREVGAWAPFLSSRDAAAMLEAALQIQPYPLDTPGLPERCRVAFKYWYWWWLDDNLDSNPIDPKDEAAYRTRSALETGWQLGIWPTSQGGRKP